MAPQPDEGSPWDAVLQSPGLCALCGHAITAADIWVNVPDSSGGRLGAAVAHGYCWLRSRQGANPVQ